MAKDDGGAAFPRPFSHIPHGAGVTARSQDGMTLREWYAGLAMQGYIVHYGVDEVRDLVNLSAMMADDLIERLKR
jgi:hypothetical protein